MENKYEDEIRKRWELEAKEKQDREERGTARPRKRLREIENGNGDAGGVFEGIMGTSTVFQEVRRLDGGGSSSSKAKTTGRTKAPARRVVASRAKSKATPKYAEESDEEYLEVLEVD